jgi:hypothetical protein
MGLLRAIGVVRFWLIVATEWQLNCFKLCFRTSILNSVYFRGPSIF